MAALSSVFEVDILDWLRGTAFPAAPVSLLLALYNSDPQDDNSGTEVAGAIGYARQPIVLNAGATVVGTGTSTSNSANIIFGPATGAWGVVTHWAIYTIGGSFRLHGAFLASKNVGIGESFTVLANTLDIVFR